MEFDDLTGCQNRVAEPPGVCGPDFEIARELTLAGMNNPANGEGITVACCRAFGEAFANGMSASAVHLRALLYVCFDANSYNTGVGYGFDGVNFTAEEFVVENKRLEEDLQAEVNVLN